MPNFKRYALLFLFAIAVLAGIFAVPAVAQESAVKAQKLSLNKKTITLYSTKAYDDAENAKRGYQLKPVISPSTASAIDDQSLVSFRSSRPTVAEVDERGNVLAVSPGTATIHVSLLDGSGKNTSCKVTVKALPVQSVIFAEGKTAKLQPGEQMQLTPVLTPAAVNNRNVTYKSSNKKVVTVTSAGKLKAVSTGKAKVTVTTKSGCRKATMTVTVGYKYRVYGISNGSYGGELKLNSYLNDLNAVNRIFGKATFEGGKVKRTMKKNLTGSQMRSFLNSIANNSAIGPDDVTIFYYSGHGADNNSSAGFSGALVGVDVSKKGASALVTVEKLTAYLKRVPGDVIVLLDSCYSGEFIASKGLNGRAMARAEAALYNQSIIQAFSSAGAPSALTVKALNPTDNARFHVITGCAADEMSYSGNLPGVSGSRSFMTFYVQCGTVGVSGYSGALAADANNDGQVSLTELHQYTAPLVFDILVRNNIKEKDASNMQIWPAGDPIPVFAMN